MIKSRHDQFCDFWLIGNRKKTSLPFAADLGIVAKLFAQANVLYQRITVLNVWTTKKKVSKIVDAK